MAHICLGTLWCWGRGVSCFHTPWWSLAKLLDQQTAQVNRHSRQLSQNLKNIFKKIWICLCVLLVPKKAKAPVSSCGQALSKVHAFPACMYLSSNIAICYTLWQKKFGLRFTRLADLNATSSISWTVSKSKKFMVHLRQHNWGPPYCSVIVCVLSSEMLWKRLIIIYITTKI